MAAPKVAPVRRVFYIETSAFGEDDTGRVRAYDQLAGAQEWLGDMLTVMQQVGGTLVIQSDRVRMPDIAGEKAAATAGLVGLWTSRAGSVRDLHGLRPESIDAEPAETPEEE